MLLERTHLHDRARFASAGLFAYRWTLTYAAFSVVVLVYGVVTQLHPHRVWALWAVAGYALAAALAARRRLTPAAVAAVIGAVVAPGTVLIATRTAQLEVSVVAESAASLITTGSPYGPGPSVLAEYNPYGPAMTLFGAPSQLFPENPLGDPRILFALFFVVCVLLASTMVLARPLPRRSRMQLTVLIASPVIALAMAVGGVDLPVVGAALLGLAAATRGRVVTTAVSFAFACALKPLAVPVLVVALVLMCARYDGRTALRAGATCAALTVVFHIPAFTDPEAFVEHTLLFPLGRTDIVTPAGESLVGGALTRLVPYGATLTSAVLAVAGVCGAVVLVRNPPDSFVRAASFAAAGLMVLFLLAPTSRFGYFVYPLVLGGTAAVSALETTRRSAGTRARTGRMEASQ
ncbi:glycosyltransferase 87 family protein [Rhodococcus artemisiae]|uniref:Glycosyltransferase 87 family protein n=1 Tax=Rhodococcus artemisiae TaxID=714159 RepID=A0ABU7L7E3_9NOCA|nr:glycosyltransferase 87 family protein [Rhodococcus artemisiae]MEE2057455.1 glycosyltransferase 87 family protein [Rhodococcus artemisiae]